MKKQHLVLLLGLVLLLSCTQAPDKAELRSEIEKANQEFMNAVAAKNADGVSALYSEDGRLMFPNMPPVEGRENIKGFFEQAIESGITGVKLTTEDVNGTNDFAIESGRYEMIAGDQTVDHGKYLVEWKKVGGKWYLHRDMPSTDIAVPASFAQKGQTVGIAIFKVKKANSQKFETFVNDVLMPATDKGTPAKSQAVKSVRFLRANGAEKDGNVRYIFMFDPHSDEMDYEIERILVAKHGKEKGEQLNKEFGSLVTNYYEYFDMEQLDQPWAGR